MYLYNMTIQTKRHAKASKQRLVNLDEAVPCIALSKNDSYVMSACGGKISLFNMMTFKVHVQRYNHDIPYSRNVYCILRFIFYQVMTTFMPPPPASTFLAFHPQDNNIIAIGMEDSTIHIYNVRVDEVITIFNAFFFFSF